MTIAHVFSTGVACERSCRPFSFCLPPPPRAPPDGSLSKGSWWSFSCCAAVLASYFAILQLALDPGKQRLRFGGQEGGNDHSVYIYILSIPQYNIVYILCILYYAYRSLIFWKPLAGCHKGLGLWSEWCSLWHLSGSMGPWSTSTMVDHRCMDFSRRPHPLVASMRFGSCQRTTGRCRVLNAQGNENKLNSIIYYIYIYYIIYIIYIYNTYV